MLLLLLLPAPSFARCFNYVTAAVRPPHSSSSKAPAQHIAQLIFNRNSHVAACYPACTLLHFCLCSCTTTPAQQQQSCYPAHTYPHPACLPQQQQQQEQEIIQTFLLTPAAAAAAVKQLGQTAFPYSLYCFQASNFKLAL
jgi:hypothetical protein